jgi:hypothetical protein
MKLANSLSTTVDGLPTSLEFLENIFDHLARLKNKAREYVANPESRLDACFRRLDDAGYLHKRWIYSPSLMLASELKAARQLSKRHLSDEAGPSRAVAEKWANNQRGGSGPTTAWKI